MAAYTHQDLVPTLAAEFPDLRGELEGTGGSLHMAMGAFAVFTQGAKERGDLGTYERCLKVADRLFAQADTDLSGALRVSFIEHLEFEGSRGPAAWQLVPLRLQAVWNQIAAENRRLMALPQKRASERPGHERPGNERPRKGRGKKRTQRRGRR